MSIEFTDFTGSQEHSPAESKGSASLLDALLHDDATKAAVRSADFVLIATGPNEIDSILPKLLDHSCGGDDEADCIRELGETWQRNFELIIRAIQDLRDPLPTTIVLVDAANPFVSEPSMSEGLPEGFATGNGALIFELLKDAMCDAAYARAAACLDVRPILNGKSMTKPVDENSPKSMRAIAEALQVLWDRPATG